MKFLLGTKQHMTQVFDDNGVVHPVTVLKTGPVVVTQVKTKEKDGYGAVQVGYGSRRPKNLSKAVKGHVKDLGNFAMLKEFKIPADATFNVGDKVELSVFAPGDTITVSAISKGKGFQGVVKRHGFKGGPRTHGQKHSEREPGSISGGLRTGPRPGKRMAGRMGSDRITVKNLTVVQVNPEQNEILVRGAVPGRRGTVVEIVG
jgi:large subunit ribosomal protein L3